MWTRHCPCEALDPIHTTPTLWGSCRSVDETPALRLLSRRREGLGTVPRAVWIGMNAPHTSMGDRIQGGRIGSRMVADC